MEDQRVKFIHPGQVFWDDVTYHNTGQGWKFSILIDGVYIKSSASFMSASIARHNMCDEVTRLCNAM